MDLSWLNKEFLSAVLKASCDDKIIRTEDFRVVDFKIKRTVEEDNCCSIMYNVRVWFKQCLREEIRDKSFIFKTVVPMTCRSFVDRETAMYLNALPKIEESLFQKLAPKLLLSQYDVLVMENIKDRGFKNVNNSNLLDYDHSVLALQALAKFHAASVLLHQNEPEYVEQTLGWESCVNNPEVDIISYLTTMFHAFEKEISTWPEARHHVRHFKFVREGISDYFQNIRNRKYLNVLNHGDFWLNNLLFSYDIVGKVQDVRMVDFQSSRYASPACDIQYFIAASTNLDVRLNKIDDLLEVYLKTLNETLSQLKLPQRLSRYDFEECLDEEYMMYFIGLVISLCACLNDPKDRFVFEGFESFEDMGYDASMRFENLLKSARYRNFIPPILDDIARKGAFLSYS